MRGPGWGSAPRRGHPRVRRSSGEVPRGRGWGAQPHLPPGRRAGERRADHHVSGLLCEASPAGQEAGLPPRAPDRAVTETTVGSEERKAGTHSWTGRPRGHTARLTGSRGGYCTSR